MIICGIKLTHDGCVALIDDHKLIFSYEYEKCKNHKRFSCIDDLDFVQEVLEQNGYSLDDVDHFIVDGWDGLDESIIKTCSGGKSVSIKAAPYREKRLSADSLKCYLGDQLILKERYFPYKSYMHSTTHVLSSYCASPFAKSKESAYILVYDGGMHPRLYYFDPANRILENCGPLFMLIGNIYSLFALHFRPYCVDGKSPSVDDLSVAGKVMAYIAKGTFREDVLKQFDIIYKQHFSPTMSFKWLFSEKMREYAQANKIPHEDILLTFHIYLEQKIISSLRNYFKRHGQKSNNFCFAGGCSLNIKWNSAIRASGLFQEIFVSPFTNDTGSAIGAACCEMYCQSENPALEWSVYSGFPIIKNKPAEGFTSRDCTIKELAKLLYETDEPVVFLHGKAELGPRALGNRSIIAPAVNNDMKERLNKIKKRENYRPVSPMCMEEYAQEIFSPGIRDPYMLFDHTLKEEWKGKIDAICHLDGTARLQTISSEDNKTVYELLREYGKMSGIPVLCNTSANYLGTGFFPDVYSATEWGQTKYVWCEGTLYEKCN